MNKTELIDSIHERLGDDATKRQAENALAAVLDAIAVGVKKDEKGIQLIGFGTFKVAHRAKRMGRNPQTKEPMKIPASKTIRFIPSAALKKTL
jgi:DNA-binding protein HU-beta